MEKESTRLLKGSLLWKSITQESFCHSKGVILILVLLSAAILSTTMMIYSTANILKSSTQNLILISLVSVMFLMTPVFAYLGERFNRFQIMKVGILLTILANLLYITLLIAQVIIGREGTFSNILIVFVLLAVLGTELYVANLPQFGSSQLQFASSSHLAAYARWTTWVFFFSKLISDVILSAFYTYRSMNFALLQNATCFSFSAF